ncbi:major facilitator superfamily protein [Massariosphaeria phaeospora]|uniref:Major facilitator superfamily protein n=1 Tax=Massariosphaeria phaeospora TaxID=100035 RepID=A0A7C8MDZ0_9PLEO|nr:major facilitator superfamily protein [Massariosphaeria phaeospora]
MEAKFASSDSENPVNWSKKKKAFIVAVGLIAITNSVLDSALPSGAIDYIAKDFNVTSEVQLALPISLYLVGYILGPLLFGPLSETYGRRVVMVPTFALFIPATLACALAPNWPFFLVFRLLCGTFASSSIAVTGGIYADIYEDSQERGRAIALYIAATAFGPQLAPAISGFVSPVSWRWAFWIGLILAGASAAPIALLPETFAPVILRKRTRALHRADPHVATPVIPGAASERRTHFVTVILARPLRMLFTEPIVLFSCLYLAFATGIFFLYFEAYPLIFQGTYGMNAGVAGLAFLPIAAGACVAFLICLLWDSILLRAKERGLEWTKKEEFRRLPLACLGGPLYVISLLWIAWTASADIHWIVPMLSGIPFGAGFVLIFISLLNYMADAYREYSASAAAAASCSRSVLGALLPLAGPSMYAKLGTNWGNSLLAFLSLGMSVIPFVFIRYGDRIREGSKFSQEVLQKRERDADETTDTV